MTDSKNDSKRPALGVALIICQQQKVLVGERIKPPQQGHWQLPGGWLRWSESPLQAVQRLSAEFKNLHLSEPQFCSYSNNIFDPQNHSVSLYFKLNCTDDNHSAPISQASGPAWRWAEWKELPQPLFLPLHLLKQSGFDPFIGDSPPCG